MYLFESPEYKNEEELLNGLIFVIYWDAPIIYSTGHAGEKNSAVKLKDFGFFLML